MSEHTTLTTATVSYADYNVTIHRCPDCDRRATAADRLEKQPCEPIDRRA